MGTASVVSICNRALAAVSARAQISSLTDGSLEAQTCALFYNPTFEALARTAHWNCLRKQGTLTLLAAAAGTPENPQGVGTLPPDPYLYQYAEPSDSIYIQGLLPTSQAPSTGGVPLTTVGNNLTGVGNMRQAIPFRVAYATDTDFNPINVILTNQSQAQAVYTVNQPNPVVWDSLLEQAVVAALAVFICTPLSLNAALMVNCRRDAEAAIMQARTADGNEGVTVIDHIPDWMRARMGGSYDFNTAGQNGGGYSPMVWPGGSTF